MIEDNCREYKRYHDFLSWVTPKKALEAEAERQGLLEVLSHVGALGAKGTKADVRRLSPGCRQCLEGAWSCLFINGICNGRCFYCPTPQNDVGLPTTNHLLFSSPRAYADYVEACGFSGVSISGGEPFLTFERSVAYLSAVRERLGPKVYLWLYTNGTRVTREKLKVLASVGLDEIRFDIGATGYHLKKAAMAVGIIPTVTVEIPMVPDKALDLKKMLPAMAVCGISHLNLHQLRLTPHNLRHLGEKDYTFLHGERVTVLESELFALSMVVHALENDIPMGINYCSSVYKHRFQGAGVRRRAALKVVAPWEDVTENGYIRRVLVQGPQENIEAVEKRLVDAGYGGRIRRESDGLALSLSLLEKEIKGFELSVRYDHAAVVKRDPLNPKGFGVPIADGTLAVERRVVSGDLKLREADLKGPTLEGYLRGWKDSRKWEVCESGLMAYF